MNSAIMMGEPLPSTSAGGIQTRVQLIRRISMETYMVRIYLGPLAYDCDFTAVEAEKTTSAEEIVSVAVSKLRLGRADKYELAEVLSSGGQLCKERRLDSIENPVRIQLLWPKNADFDGRTGISNYRFYLRTKDSDSTLRTNSWRECPSDMNPVDSFLLTFLRQPTNNKEYPDLCNLPDLNEITLLENIKNRFHNSNIYTYVGSILIAVNPFKFFPIYNPKYVKMYQNKRLGELPPHIFAIADAAFYTMLRKKKNQCIVISGESGSGKTESTNLLLHHLTALSQKGTHGSGVEQTILGAGPVLEAFGNAKTVHNNNSSRFGKFIQVNYKENGMVHGAIVEKYLLEKSRIVSQARNERNYHVFYYLLAGADEQERESLHLGKPSDYHYLAQSDCVSLEGEDEAHEFARLKQSMEMVGFSPLTQKRIFSVMSAVLLLGNVVFRKKGDQHHDESVALKDDSIIKTISSMLKVKEKTLVEALTQKRATAGDETVVMNYKMEDAIATRDAMAKCLYGALFDWIVLKVNQALLAKRHNSDHQGNSIGVLDIFGFEDFQKNSFEQFCINYANEHLQYYFNQHIFKFEQEEYEKEGIQWKNIEFIDNTGCLELFSKKPHGLFSLLDEECNFPGATHETLLSKFNHHHKDKIYYQKPQLREEAFIVVHYAGKVKYLVKDFREKNGDQIRTDIVCVLKSSSLTFVRELMGVDPVAVLRWSIIKTLVKSVFAFIAAGRKYRNSGGLKAEEYNKNRKNSEISIHESLVVSEHLLNPRSPRRSNRSRARSPLYEPAMFMEDHVHHHHAYDEDSAFIEGTALASPNESFMSNDEFKIFRKANKVILKNKSFRPKPKPPTMLRDIKTLKAIASRTMYGGSRVTTKKQPASVSAQFQWSLSKLMSTLQQANPFFIRCIKSNAEKAACVFDDVLVLRQLRYTGMLATVKIRQAGYNHRLTFEEFTQLYKILLPKGLQSTKEDVAAFLKGQHLNQDNYQIGITKVFLRESEKICLDESLHKAIMRRVVRVQRWFKTILERRHYLQMKTSIVVIQACIRMHIAVKKKNKLIMRYKAVITIQRYYRGYRERSSYLQIVNSILLIQSWRRGCIVRREYRARLEKHRKEEELRRQKMEEIQSSNSDEGILTKDSSAEELVDSAGDRSSGIHEAEDSEPETISVELQNSEKSTVTPPPSPSSSDSIILIQPTIKLPKDEYLNQARSTSRVSSLAKTFQDKESQMDRPSPGTIHLERGTHSRSRWSKSSPAPLAKQESFSDLEPSSPSPSGKLLSPDKLKSLEECLQKEPSSPVGDFSNKSPFRKARRHFKNFMGGKRGGKKDAQGDESDEEQEVHPAKRPHNFGVAVLPGAFPEPKSPRSPTDSAKSFDVDHKPSADEPKEGHRRRRKKPRPTKPPLTEKTSSSPTRSNWNVAGTSQWQYPADWIVTDLSELTQLDAFIYKKLNEYNKDSKKDTIFDGVFKGSLKQFHTEMQATISIEKQKGEVNIPYRILLQKFAHCLEAQVALEGTNATFPVTMGVNAFRGFLDEFKNKHQKKKDKKEEKKVENRSQKKEREKKKDIYEYQGHKYSLVQFGIPTFCEYCSNIIWIMEKGSVCQVCKYTCHKKCVTKSTNPCKGSQVTQNPGTKVFGAVLVTLVDDTLRIPVIVERLIAMVELHGLYTVGIYRKAGANAKIKLLKQNIDSGKEDLSSLDITEYPIHVITTVLKSFFRELPEPLLTYEQYDDFLRAAEIQDERERVQSLYAVIEKLPKANHDLFERLVFHLARVSNYESINKMGPNALAIIFAPALLRTNKRLQAQDSLNQVPRQTIVIKHIISEQLQKMKDTLNDISTLETAEASAGARLEVVRNSKRARSPVRNLPERTSQPEGIIEVTVEDDGDMYEDAEEERVLCSHINSIRQERENLTSKLPVLECRHHSSDDDGLSTDGMDSMCDTADEEEKEEYAVTFELPVSPPTQLQHLTKRRVSSLPQKRLPEKYKIMIESYSTSVRLRSYSSENFSDQLDSSTASGSSRTDRHNSPVLRPIHGREPSWESGNGFVSMPALQNICEDEDEIMV